MIGDIEDIRCLRKHNESPCKEAPWVNLKVPRWTRNESTVKAKEQQINRLAAFIFLGLGLVSRAGAAAREFQNGSSCISGTT